MGMERFTGFPFHLFCGCRNRHPNTVSILYGSGVCGKSVVFSVISDLKGVSHFRGRGDCDGLADSPKGEVVCLSN